MIIVVLEKPYILELDWAPYSPFVWYARTAFIGYTQPTRYDSSYDMTEPALNITPIDLTTVFIDDIRYESKTSVALCQATEKSFYMDVAGQFIYIHYDHTKRPVSSDFNSQSAIGYCSGKSFYDSNDFCYEPLVKSATSITVLGDTNKINFPKQNIKLKNQQADFDSFEAEAIPGADVKIKYISSNDLAMGKTALTEIYTGFSTGDTLTTTDYSIVSENKRKQLNIEVPNDYYSTSDGLKGNGEIIPDGYNSINRVIATPLDETTNPTYQVANEAASIGIVGTLYTEAEISLGDNNWGIVGINNIDLPNGTFQLIPGAVAGEPPEIRVEATIRAYANPADQIADLMYRYLGIQFTSENYDIDEWNAEKTYLADTTLYMDERKPLFDWIQTIQTASNYDFQLITKPDGRWSIKVRDIQRAVSETVQSICNIDMRRATKRNFNNYASSITVKYGYEPEPETFKRVVNDDYKEAVIDKYRLEKNIEVETYLTTQTAAESKAALLALEYSVARSTISTELDELSTIQIYDVIQIDNSFYEGLNKTRDYIGTKKIMVTKITYDFGRESTKIEGLDITDI